MDHIQIRRSSGSITFSILLLSILFCAPFVYGLRLLYIENLTMFYILTSTCTILFFVPIIFIISVELYQYFTIVNIAPSGITVSYPSKKARHIARNEILAMGFFNPYPKDSRIFFCMASKEEVIRFLESHPKEFRRMFGKKMIAKLSTSEDVKWKMALAVYMRYSKSRKMLFVYNLSERLLKEIATILEQKIINTGHNTEDILRES